MYVRASLSWVQASGGDVEQLWWYLILKISKQWPRVSNSKEKESTPSVTPRDTKAKHLAGGIKSEHWTKWKATHKRNQKKNELLFICIYIYIYTLKSVRELIKRNRSVYPIRSNPPSEVTSSFADDVAHRGVYPHDDGGNNRCSSDSVSESFVAYRSFPTRTHINRHIELRVWVSGCVRPLRLHRTISTDDDTGPSTDADSSSLWKMQD